MELSNEEYGVRAGQGWAFFKLGTGEWIDSMTCYQQNMAQNMFVIVHTAGSTELGFAALTMVQDVMALQTKDKISTRSLG